MNMQEVEAYLEKLGAQEKEIRAVLSDTSATVGKRTAALKLLNDIQIFLRGFFASLRLTVSEEKARHYKEYYEQARSKRGLNL